MKNRLLTGLGRLLVSTATLFSSGCEICNEMCRAPYYDTYSYYEQSPCFSTPYYQPIPQATVFSTPYYQQIPYFQPINQGIENRNSVYNRNEIPSIPTDKSIKSEPAPQPPKPVPEEIPTPEPLKPISLNRKPVNENISKN